jgi:hypothetical protein
MLLYDDRPFIHQTRRALQALLPLAGRRAMLPVFPLAHRGMVRQLTSRWEQAPDRDAATEVALAAAREILAVPDGEAVRRAQVQALCGALAELELAGE